MIRNAKRIPHAAFRRAGYNKQALVVYLCARLVNGAAHAAYNILHAYAVKVEPLAAGKYCCGYALRLGRGQYEQHMLRRLLQRFKQRIERRT